MCAVGEAGFSQALGSFTFLSAWDAEDLECLMEGPPKGLLK